MNILQKIQESEQSGNSGIEVNLDFKCDNLLELYKSICLKLILVSESSVYKIYKFKSIEQNLLSNEINTVISCYLSDLFNRLETECFDDNIDKLISDILLLSEDTRLQILKKVFCLVDEFYKYILEREKLDVSSYDIYMGIFNKLLSEYIESNKVDIIKTLLDNNFNLETNFNLTIDN